MMYVQRQVVNYDLLVVMNGHKALCLPLFAAAEVCYSGIAGCVQCSVRDKHNKGFNLNMQFMRVAG